MDIQLGFSTCPNDTFIFDALVHQRIETAPLSYNVIMEDILHLNQQARAGALDMVKISFNAFGHVADDYHLLDAGSALGFGCGPLLISKRPFTREELSEKAKELRVAIPGIDTTANLLLGFYAPEIQHKEVYLFHEVMPAVMEGKADLGLIIHENRFTYQQYGLTCVQDLGEYWEAETSHPIPLGGIVAKKSLGSAVIAQLERQLRASVEYAFAHPAASQAFVSEHAQEMAPEVMQAHIDLYVNAYSRSLGTKGRDAVEKLLSVGHEMGLYPQKPVLSSLSS